MPGYHERQYVNGLKKHPEPAKAELSRALTSPGAQGTPGPPRQGAGGGARRGGGAGQGAGRGEV